MPQFKYFATCVAVTMIQPLQAFLSNLHTGCLISRISYTYTLLVQYILAAETLYLLYRSREPCRKVASPRYNVRFVGQSRDGLQRSLIKWYYTTTTLDVFQR